VLYLFPAERLFLLVRFPILLCATVIELTLSLGSSDPIYFKSWAMGRRYTSIDGTSSPSWVTGFIDPSPIKPQGLLDSSGDVFVRSRPQYENIASGGFVIATANNIKNDGTGDQSGAINTLLANSVGKPVFFPAGVYQIQGTVTVPVGSIIVGEGWSQVNQICESCYKPDC
jgi:glucan 1,3-beta-glucosidase